MLRGIGLHQHLSRSLAPPGTARQLQQQLQRLLARAEIGAMQKPIGREHRREGDPRQIHTLGQHLRANQDVCLPGGKAVQKASMPITPPRGIPIEAEQAQAFKLLGEQFQHLLRPGTKGFERRGTTVTATVLQVLTVITPMASQPLASPLAPMDSERHIAMGTHHHLTATAAAQKRAVSPARHQDHRLFALLRQGRKSIHQSAAHQALVTFSQLMAHINHMHWR